MICAEVYFTGTQIKGFIVSGHAGMAPKGEDLVCAAVSALAQTALLGLDAHIGPKFTWEIDEAGKVECFLAENLPENEKNQAQVVLRTLELGLQAIEESNGQYLKVSKRRWTKCCSK